MGEHDLELTLAEVGSATALAHDAYGEQKSQRVGVRLVEVGAAGNGQSPRGLHLRDYVGDIDDEAVPVWRRAIAGLSPRDVRLREQRVHARAPLVVRVHLDPSRIVVIPREDRIDHIRQAGHLYAEGFRSRHGRSLPDGWLRAKPVPATLIFPYLAPHSNKVRDQPGEKV